MQLGNLKSVIIGVGAAAAFIAITGAASGIGVGAVFNLGKTNKVNATSVLTGSTSKPMLSVTNSGSGTALNLKAGSGKAPFSVNSSVQVPKLNASLLGGLAASQFVQGGGQSLTFGFSMSTASTAQRKLLSVPGFGTFNAVCGPSAGGGFADVTFLTGPHAMDKFTASLTSGSSIGVSNANLIPNTNFAVALVQSGEVSAVWERQMLRYATGSSSSLTTHLATIDIMVDVNTTTCDFDASASTASQRGA